MEIIVIKKKRYVMGLSPWLALPSRGKSSKLAAQKAKTLKGKGICVRPSPIPQVGIINEWAFTKRGEPLKNPGIGTIYSLATAIAGNQPESWAGFFHVAEKLWWVISVMNGVIVPDGDYLTNDEETARKFYDLEMSRLPQEVNPVEINDIQEAIQWIESHIARRYVGKIQKIGIDQKQIAIAGAIGAIVLIGAGAEFWNMHEESIERAKARAALILKLRQEQIAKEKKETSKQQMLSKQSVYKPKPLPKPWVGKPFYTGYTQAVKKIFDRLPLNENGWKLENLDCSNVSCVATYKMDTKFSTFWYIPKGGVANISAKTVNVSYPIHYLSAVEKQNIGIKNLSLWLIGWMEVHQIKGDVSDVSMGTTTDMPPMIQGAPQPMPPVQNMNNSTKNGGIRPYPLKVLNGQPKQPRFLPPTWKTFSWKMKTTLPPWTMDAISVDGVVPESVQFEPSSSEWKINGEVYEPIN